MSVVQDNEAVCMRGIVTVHSLGTSGLNYCLTSHSKPTTVISLIYAHRSCIAP